MASKDLGTAAPHLKKKTVAVRKKQLQLQQMLSNPKGISTTIHGWQEESS